VNLNITATVHVHLHDADTKQQLNRIEQSVQALGNFLNDLKGYIMASGQDLSQNLKDITGLAHQLIDYVVSRDSEMNKLKQDLKDAVDRANLSDQQKADLQASMDTAFQDSETTENDLRASIAGLPPVGGTPLLLTYADRSSFDAAVAAYTGPEGITVDGAEVKAGTTPSLDYFTHSADGHVDTVGPTD
jgi:chromosome segregation ATPase